MPRRHRADPRDPASVFARLEELVLASAGRDGPEVLLRLAAAAQVLDPPDPAASDTSLAAAGRDALVRASQRWPAAELTPELALPDATLAACLRVLVAAGGGGPAHEWADAVFEQAHGARSKGSKGQYFTPRHVVEACVRALDPRPGERVVDPACGSGAFLVHALLHQRRQGPADGAGLVGVDLDPDALRVARLQLAMAGGAAATLHPGDGLCAQPPAPGSADVVLSNPPFAGEVTDPAHLGRYALARAGGRVERDLLFLERCVELMAPGGRLALVLPQNKVGGARWAFARRWLLERVRVIAVLGLARPTFQPWTGQKAVVLLGQRRGAPPRGDEPILMLVSERSGKDRNGRPRLRPGVRRPYPAWTALDHDLDDAVARVRAFAAEHLGWSA